MFESVEGRIEWWRLESGRFVEIQPEGGIYKSVLFPGLWLDAEALRSANSPKPMGTLQQGMGPA